MQFSIRTIFKRTFSKEMCLHLGPNLKYNFDVCVVIMYNFQLNSPFPYFWNWFSTKSSPHTVSRQLLFSKGENENMMKCMPNGTLREMR